MADGHKQSLKFYGMSSAEAQEKHQGGVKDYSAAEGKCVEVSYKGPVGEVLRQVTGGLRSLVLTSAQTPEGFIQMLYVRKVYRNSPPCFRLTQQFLGQAGCGEWPKHSRRTSAAVSLPAAQDEAMAAEIWAAWRLSSLTTAADMTRLETNIEEESC